MNVCAVVLFVGLLCSFTEGTTVCRHGAVRGMKGLNLYKFQGDWRELAKTTNGFADVKNGLWRFSFNVQGAHTFDYTALDEYNHCTRPTKGHIQAKLELGELTLEYFRFSNNVEEWLKVLYTDYDRVAVLYRCQNNVTGNGVCPPTALHVSILTRSDLDVADDRKIRQALDSICANLDVLQPQDIQDSCQLQMLADDDDVNYDIPDKCLKPPDAGLCRGSFKSYFFNQTSKTCQEFIYGGCGGNKNNFPTEMECKETCIENKTYGVGICKDVAPCGLLCPKCCTLSRDSCIECQCSDVDYDSREFVKSGGACVQVPNGCPSSCEANLKSPSCYICNCSRKDPSSQEVNSLPAGHEAFEVQTELECPISCRLKRHEHYKQDSKLYCDCESLRTCKLPAERGPCNGHHVRYFYNPSTHKCETFSYSGCGGNLNSFETQYECQLTCFDSCRLPKDPGPCKMGKHRRYYHNERSGECQRFEYSGCGGNENNFISLRNCQLKCENVCQKVSDPGPCPAYKEYYYYNFETKQCMSFFYGGCQGNGNKFPSKTDCQQKCENVDICMKPYDSGPCYAAFKMYYYNIETQQCEDFIYGGCQGNDNRFSSIELCQKTCGGISRQNSTEENLYAVRKDQLDGSVNEQDDDNDNAGYKYGASHFLQGITVVTLLIVYFV